MDERDVTLETERRTTQSRVGRGSVTLARVRSVPIRAHWTLVAILPYLAFVFATRFEAAATASGVSPSATSLPPFVHGLLVALGLFVSIALHELAHTFVAVRAGGQVRAITLMMLGGVSEVERLPKRPRNEALMAAAGPLMSFAIAGVLFGLERLIPTPAARIDLFYLARLNVVLGVFNLLPAFPMDGGRILRALLAGRLGMARATRIAATVGKAAAIAFAIIGALGGSVMLMLIALFLFTGATFEMRAHEVSEALRQLRVGELMAAPAPTIDLYDTVAEAFDRMRRSSRLDLVVIEPGYGPRGVVHASDLAQVNERERPAVRLADLGPKVLSPFMIARPDEPAGDALERARGRGAAYLIVVDPAAPDASAVGIVGPAEVEHVFALRSIGARRRPRMGERAQPV
jgi:Zn-dependent protease/CBS domain-containing protein